jgi:hypothetical protein
MVGKQAPALAAEDEPAPILANQPGKLGNPPCHMQVEKIFFLVDGGESGILPNGFAAPVRRRRLPADVARQVAGGGGFNPDYSRILKTTRPPLW